MATPLSKTRASLIASLGSRKMRLKHCAFVAEGEKCVGDTLGHFDLIALVATHEWLENHLEQCGRFADCAYVVDPSEMRRISTLQTPSEVLALYRIPEQTEPEVDCNELYLLLDGIQDPGNLGSIVRTADWYGIRHIFASRDTADIYNPKAVMATMGSIARVRVSYLDLCSLSESHPEMPLYGTLLDGADIYKARLTRGGFIAFGNEGKGLTQELRRRVDKPLLIPPFNPAGHGESLNVAASAAIVLSEFRRRIKGYGKD